MTWRGCHAERGHEIVGSGLYLRPSFDFEFVDDCLGFGGPGWMGPQPSIRLIPGSLLTRTVASERSRTPDFRRVPMPGRWGAWRWSSRMSRLEATMSLYQPLKNEGDCGFKSRLRRLIW